MIRAFIGFITFQENENTGISTKNIDLGQGKLSIRVDTKISLLYKKGE